MPLTDKQFYEQTSEKFFKALGSKAGKIVKYSMLLRFVINLLFARLNVSKALKNFKTVALLGAACGTFNVIFHLIRRFFALKRRQRKALLQQAPMD